MNNHAERRKHVRHLTKTLVVEIDGKTYPIVNLSSGGVFFRATGYFVGNPIKLTIRSIQNENESINADCKVVENRLDCVHVEFTKPTMPLMHFVIGHIGQAMGVKPQYFKKPEGTGKPSNPGAA